MPNIFCHASPRCESCDTNVRAWESPWTCREEGCKSHMRVVAKLTTGPRRPLDVQQRGLTASHRKVSTLPVSSPGMNCALCHWTSLSQQNSHLSHPKLSRLSRSSCADVQGFNPHQVANGQRNREVPQGQRFKSPQRVPEKQSF